MERPPLNRIESLAFAVVAVALALGAWWWTGADNTPPASPVSVVLETTPPPAAPSLLTVHVAGEVRRPGVVTLPAGSRTVDAIEAAGGATVAARLTAVNLASPLSDGDQVLVPSQLADAPGGAVGSDDTVAVNRASASELETLPGVGPVLAARIVGHRDDHGPFQAAEDLLDVPGIGEATLARLRPHIRVP